MAWTQIDIDALKSAIKTGHRRVTYGDRTVEYRDLNDMLRALKLMEAETASNAVKTTPSRTVLVKHARGV